MLGGIHGGKYVQAKKLGNQMQSMTDRQTNKQQSRWTGIEREVINNRHRNMNETTKSVDMRIAGKREKEREDGVRCWFLRHIKNRSNKAND
jgi:hypothetical protein